MDTILYGKSMNSLVISSLPLDLSNSFIFKQINTNDPRMDDVYRLRYQVYCLECGFENPEDHPHGLERDAYDNCSSHFCAISVRSGKIVGTVRIIHATSLGLPIQEHGNLKFGIPSECSTDRVGEVSRLAISKNFREREINRIVANMNAYADQAMGDHVELRRTLESHIVSGLYRCLHQYCLDVGITHLYAVMAKGLPRLLKRNHIYWTQIGKEVDYHGLRIPYMRAVHKNLELYKAA
jgi:N-acyl amino acid synthase of PEP-CTERM/exosortase system